VEKTRTRHLPFYAPEVNPETKKKDVVWFALNDDRPLFVFAGIWTTFKGDRGTKSKPIPGPHQVYGFLTTAYWLRRFLS
jgi:putative SOS response-associated peptidase YedK